MEERGKEKVLEAIALLEQREDILYACPDYIFSVQADEGRSIPDNAHWDPEEVINLLDAQNMVYNGDPVVVGVLDTGIDAQHSDLAQKVDRQLSKNFVTHTTAKEDGTIIQEANIDPCTDLHGHGTHVAGIIAETAGNVSLISLRVLDSHKDGYSSALIAALDYVMNVLPYHAEKPTMIPILNFSGAYSLSDAGEISELYDKIPRYWGLFVCGAGNNNQKLKSYGSGGSGLLLYPASFNFVEDDRMIVVGASNQADNGLWTGTSGSGSNYGQSTVDIFAPGDNILSCYPEDLCDDPLHDEEKHHSTGYHYMSGTSMATPYVTGVAALIMSIHPSKSAADIKTLIINNDDNKSWLTGECVSGGRLNAYKALDASHTYIVWSTNSYGCISYRCTECEYVKTVHPQPLLTQPNDSSTHFHLCPGCGYQTEESHTWGGWANYNALCHRRVCTVCGYEDLQKHFYLPGDTTRTCRICHRSDIIPGDGILSIHGEEELPV